MQLQLLDGDGKLICEMDNDSAILGSYPVENGHKIHVCGHECRLQWNLSNAVTWGPKILDRWLHYRKPLQSGHVKF